MRTWYLAKVKYQKEDEESGLLKSVTEAYLFDALSFTEAETRVYEELGDSIRGEWTITNINKTKILDVFTYPDADIYYRCKIEYTVADGDSGKEKKVVNLMLVTAHDVREAYDRIYESLSNMLVTFRVPEVVESPIVEVFPYQATEEAEEPEIPANLKGLVDPETGELIGEGKKLPAARKHQLQAQAQYVRVREEEIAFRLEGAWHAIPFAELYQDKRVENYLRSESVGWFEGDEPYSRESLKVHVGAFGAIPVYRALTQAMEDP
ncbi:MAG TPA: hypothetical protein DCR93_33950, partial [Cytophagales bacterium]|nr:hypothetical protein [Cytophagales bacterium]